MTEEKKECGCCSQCNSEEKELSKEELEKVTGGTDIHEQGTDAHLVNGKYICKTWKVDEGYWKGATCKRNKTVDGVENVCICEDKTNGKCCRVYGDKSTCCHWYKKLQKCSQLDNM